MRKFTKESTTNFVERPECKWNNQKMRSVFLPLVSQKTFLNKKLFTFFNFLFCFLCARMRSGFLVSCGGFGPLTAFQS